MYEIFVNGHTMMLSRAIKTLLLLSFFIITAAKAEPNQLILIAVDGFAEHYFDQYSAPNIKKLAQEGTKAQSLQPVFPTKTFPNHYSIATGLYPANHGIIENNIYDSDFNAIFRISKSEEATKSRWWQGEPIWVSAELQGLKTATYFYPGSEAAIKEVRPSYWQRYDGKITHQERVDSVLKWLDLPQNERPSFLSLYFSAVDDAGHNFGSNSPQVASAITSVDNAIGSLIEGLKTRNLYNKVNIILVSDHGMADTPPQNVIVLDKLFNTDDALLTLWTPEMVSIFPKEGQLESIYNTLKKSLPKEATVYKKEELPDYWHYKNNKRIAPLLVLPQIHWRLIQSQHEDIYKQLALKGRVNGSHGYDNRLAKMQAVFIAQGPAFEAGRVVPSFINIEIYNLMSRLLGIKPAPNDGNPNWPDTILKQEPK